jgi:hypothetical protein
VYQLPLRLNAHAEAESRAINPSISALGAGASGAALLAAAQIQARRKSGRRRMARTDRNAGSAATQSPVGGGVLRRSGHASPPDSRAGALSFDGERTWRHIVRRACAIGRRRLVRPGAQLEVEEPWLES